MDDTLRARIRTQLERIVQAVRILPALGFGRPRRHPTGPIHRSMPHAEGGEPAPLRDEGAPRPHDEDHERV